MRNLNNSFDMEFRSEMHTSYSALMAYSKQTVFNKINQRSFLNISIIFSGSFKEVKPNFSYNP